MDPTFQDLPLAAIRRSDVQNVVAGLTALGKAPGTVRGVYRVVSGVLAAAIADQLITRNPALGVKLPRSNRDAHALVPLTVEQLLALADTVPPRYRALILTAAGLGLRQGEACGLTVDRVDRRVGTVRIDRQLVTPPSGPVTFGPCKTTASVRMIPLAPEVADVLADHLREYGSGPDGRNGSGPEGLIFTTDEGVAVRRQYTGAIMRTATAALGLEGVTFHDLRHYAASVMLSNGCSVRAVSSALGHSSAVETLRTYAHLMPSDEDTVRAALGAGLALPSRAVSGELSASR